MASELIIQLQNRDGSFNCEKFDNLPSPKSTYIAICFTDNPESERLAVELKTNLINSIISLGTNFVSSTPPCGGGAVGFNRCKALRIENNLKILIVVSDGASNLFANPDILLWAHTVLPILPRGIQVTLPYPLNAPQAEFWLDNITETIPTIWGLIGISDEDRRIFISYKQKDTSAFAEQLCHRLSDEHFEVFLDRFSINPGVNFQNRLYQELADKAMVVFLESQDFLSSQWIQLEIDFAKKYRLGLFALNIDKSPKVPSIDDEYRKDISLVSNTGLLAIPALDNIVADIQSQHSIALYRRRNYLNSSVVAALQHNGANVDFDSNGFISVTNHSGNLLYKIWTTPRPPKISDYHYSNISNLTDEKVIVGPEFIENKRKALNTWLSQKSNVSFYNEGEILNLSNLIYP